MSPKINEFAKSSCRASEGPSSHKFFENINKSIRKHEKSRIACFISSLSA